MDISLSLFPTIVIGQPASKKPEKFAVLLIDADYGLKKDVYLNLKPEIENMKKVLKQANKKDVPVFEITFFHATDPGLKKFRKTSWISMEKLHMNAFKGTRLHKKLNKMGVTSLVLMGFNQSVCVKETAAAAKRLGYKVYTSFDLMQGTIRRRSECSFKKSSGKVKYGKCHKFDRKKGALSVIEDNFSQDLEFYGKNTTLLESHKNLPIFDPPAN